MSVTPTVNSVANQRLPVTRVLVVADLICGGMLRSALEGHGYQVDLTENGGQARSVARLHHPDFIFVEALLPAETGFELLNGMKRAFPEIPLVIWTEIDLDEARNLAIWCGADGYFTKGMPIPELLRMIDPIADVVWKRFHGDQPSDESRIEFRCKCGQRLSAELANVGKAVNCRRCMSMVIVPRLGTQASGLWASDPTMQDAAANEHRRQLAKLFCDVCGKMLPLIANSRFNQVQCPCGRRVEVPSQVLEQRQFYFQTAEPQPDYLPIQSWQRFLEVDCSKCGRDFVLTAAQAGGRLVCPHCADTNEQFSLRGSHLVRAALTATGRLFLIQAGLNKGKKFLLPLRKRITLGSSPEVTIPLSGIDVADRHCRLSMSAQGPVIEDLNSGLGTIVNQQRIEAPTLLLPGDEIRLGEIRVRLLGNHPQLQASQQKSSSQSGSQRIFKGSAEDEIAHRAASVIQMHWEQLAHRLRLAGLLDQLVLSTSEMAPATPAATAPGADEPA